MSNYIPISEISGNSIFYPCVSLPDSIVSNYPKLVTTTKQVAINSPESNRAASDKFRPSSWISISGSISIVSFLALVARYLDLYKHDGLSVLAIAIFLVSLCSYGILAIKERGRYRHYLQRLARNHKTKTPQYQTVVVTSTQYPDWSKILAGKVKVHDGVSKAPVGSSEREFSKYLNRYFKSSLHPSYSFKIPNFEGDGYSADFCLKLNCGLSIVIEIDEPYVYKTGEPHHCIDVGKDDVRDRFFADGNWVTVRFNERQVVLQPDACCYFVARVISGITGENAVLDRFDRSISLPKRDRRWTTAEARQMAEAKYRDTYLPKFGSPEQRQKPVIRQQKPVIKQEKPVIKSKQPFDRSNSK